MKAMQIYNSAEGPMLRFVQVLQPIPDKSEILIRVEAVGVTPTELGWYPTTHAKSGAERSNAIPGHEFSGVIAATGEDVKDFTVGQAVYGMNDWFADGATAEFCLTLSSNIVPKPATLTHVETATVPIGALTAWQGLFDHAKLQPGERVLVHGGSGAVGLFAVQLARRQGAYVVSTTSTQNLSLVAKLGANEVIDYKNSRFHDLVRDIDVVFDTVGGETRDLSWSVLKPNGRMITVAADGESSSDPRIKNNYFIVEPNQKQLIEVARLLDAGSLKTFVNAAVPFEDAPRAYARSVPQKLGYGKVVINITDNSRS
jgi:NADPH:quinone reductase-like Zn-dependent oxidoreductase